MTGISSLLLPVGHGREENAGYELEGQHVQSIGEQQRARRVQPVRPLPEVLITDRRNCGQVTSHKYN